MINHLVYICIVLEGKYFLCGTKPELVKTKQQNEVKLEAFDTLKPFSNNECSRNY